MPSGPAHLPIDPKAVAGARLGLPDQQTLQLVLEAFGALSDPTKANHVSNILTKLHASDRTEVIIRARDVGLGG